MPPGPKQPWALGRSVRQVWSEIWNDVGPRAESVLRTGQATWEQGLQLLLERQGFKEETYHTFSNSPVPDDQGRIGGMLCVVAEDTERTLGERRRKTLRDLAARTPDETKTVETVWPVTSADSGRPGGSGGQARLGSGRRQATLQRGRLRLPPDQTGGPRSAAAALVLHRETPPFGSPFESP